MSGKRIQSLVSHPFFRSSVLVTVFSFLASIFSYLFNVIVVKSFPVAVYGEYAAANSYVGILSVPIVAFGTVIIRRIGREMREERATTVANLESWILSQCREFLPVSSIGIIFLWWFSTRVGNISNASFFFIVISIGFLLFQNFYGNALQSFQWFGRYGVYLVITTFLKVLLGLLVVFFFPTLFGLYVSLLLTALIAVYLGRSWVVTSSADKAKKTQFGKLQLYLRSRRAIVPLITTVGLIGLSSVDVIVAKAVLAPTTAGMYGTLSLLSKIILFVTTPMSTVAFVFFTDKEQKHRSHFLLLLGLLAVAVAGGIAVVAYALLPTFIIQIVASGAYLEVAPTLWAGAVFGTVYSMVMMLGNFFISKNHSAGQASIGAVLVQAILLYFFHDTMIQMMLVNIFSCFLLLVYYGMVIFRSAH